MVSMLIQMQRLMSSMSVDPLNPGGATQFLPYADGQTGFFSDFAPLAATCDPNVFLGLAAPSASCQLGLAASNAQLGALVKYKNTDAGACLLIICKFMYTAILWLR